VVGDRDGEALVVHHRPPPPEEVRDHIQALMDWLGRIKLHPTPAQLARGAADARGGAFRGVDVPSKLGPTGLLLFPLSLALSAAGYQGTQHLVVLPRCRAGEPPPG
jgi:hypothetical protein